MAVKLSMRIPPPSHRQCRVNQAAGMRMAIKVLAGVRDLYCLRKSDDPLKLVLNDIAAGLQGRIDAIQDQLRPRRKGIPTGVKLKPKKVRR